MLFCKLWWNSRRLTLEESRCNKICHGFTFHIPSDYLPLNIIKNAVCSSFWLFYYNFIPEAEHIHDVFSFLSCYRKSSVIYLFQRLDMKKESNEIHNVFYKLSGLYWHVIIPSFHVVIFEHQILCGTVKSEGGMRFIFWAFIFLVWLQFSMWKIGPRKGNTCLCLEHSRFFSSATLFHHFPHFQLAERPAALQGQDFAWNQNTTCCLK